MRRLARGTVQGAPMFHCLSRAGSRFFAGFTLRESIVVGLCAVFIVLSALLLHVPAMLPGHKLWAVVFFLLLGRGCIRPPLAATTIGLLAGLIALYPGLGRGNHLHIVQYALAGGLVDALFFWLPGLTCSRPLGMVAGALVGGIWLVFAFLMDLLVGMDVGTAVQHALLKTFWVIAWGAFGGFLAPTVVRRLQASGLVPSQNRSRAARLPG